jgi:pyruvate dehydrogenase E1 component
LRDFFEVDARYIAYAALYTLAQEQKISNNLLKKAQKDLKIDPQKQNPMDL